MTNTKNNFNFSFQIRLSAFALILLIAPALAVLNKSPERREAPFDTYGPPPSDHHGLPPPVYGVPTGPVHRYPPPPPDIPPPQGIPVLKYGPPKVHVEYGPPPQQHHHHHHHQSKPYFGPPKKVSFFDQVKSSFGFGQNNFGLRPPSHSYGPPKQSYGPPPQFNHGPSFINHGPSIHHSHHVPSHSYGPPQQSYGPPAQSYGPPPPQFQKPLVQHLGPPSLSYAPNFGGHSSFSSGSSGFIAPPEIKCDGWRPIPGPAIQGNDHHHQHQQIHGDGLPETSYSAPLNTLGLGAIEEQHVEVGIQLPHHESAQNFLGELGATDVNIVKSEGIEVSFEIYFS